MRAPHEGFFLHTPGGSAGETTAFNRFNRFYCSDMVGNPPTEILRSNLTK
jgi:hypothetical protein